MERLLLASEYNPVIWELRKLLKDYWVDKWSELKALRMTTREIKNGCRLRLDLLERLLK